MVTQLSIQIRARLLWYSAHQLMRHFRRALAPCDFTPALTELPCILAHLEDFAKAEHA